MTSVVGAAAAACGDGDAPPISRKLVDVCLAAGGRAASPSPQRLRRLADVEMEAVLSELVGEPVSVSATLIPDPRADGYDNDVKALVVSGSKLEGYIDAIEPLLDRIVARRPCAPGAAPRDCAAGFARETARRAYGRPITDDELTKLLGVFDDGAAGGAAADGLKLVAEAILLAPSALYRSEIGSPLSGGDAQLDDFEIASQLSFLLTGARPDDELYGAAERGELRDPKVVRAHGERLLATPRARTQLRRFVVGWLELGRLGSARRGIEMSEFTPAVRSAMEEELGRFVEHTIWDGPGTLEALLTSSVTYPDEALAPIYGPDLLDPPRGDVPARLDPTRRKGVLSLAAFLTGHATRDGTNPVDRGLFVRNRLFCSILGAPPVSALTMPVDVLSDEKTTTRQKFEKHLGAPLCVSCHHLIDPVGFGFERFDAIGRYRTQEHGLNVDDSGELDGSDVDGAFRGPAELADRLVTSDDARLCFVSQVARFAGGEDTSDVCAYAGLALQPIRSGAVSIKDLLLDYATRPEFFVRRVAPEGP
jgi:hypothetical protein